MANVSVNSPNNDAKIKNLLPVTARKILAKELQIATAASEASYQRYQTRQAETPDLQRLCMELESAKEAPKRDKAAEQEIESRIKDFKDRQAAEDAEAEAQARDFMNNATPSAYPSVLDPWVRLDLKTHQKAFNYFEELPTGKTTRDMVDECRDRATPLQARRAATLKAPQTTAETTAVIAAEVRRVGAKALLTARSARYLDYNPDRSRFEQRPFKLPNLKLFDGVGKDLSVPDAMGLLCLLFPEEVTDRLTALALNGDDDSSAMNRGDREAALARVNAEILANDRRGEFWIRQCRAKNIAGGPRWTDDARAILDIE